MSRIFLVEDDAAVAELLHDFLSGRGHNMILCERSVEAGLETAREALIDVGIIATSVKGLSIAAVLKERGIPFILIGGSAASVPNLHFRRVPMLSKPFSLSVLAAELQRLVSP